MASQQLHDEGRDFEKGIEEWTTDHTSPMLEEEPGIGAIAVSFIISSVPVEPVPVDSVAGHAEVD